jgi:hypothetical protein
MAKGAVHAVALFVWGRCRKHRRRICVGWEMPDRPARMHDLFGAGDRYSLCQMRIHGSSRRIRM